MKFGWKAREGDSGLLIWMSPTRMETPRALMTGNHESKDKIRNICYKVGSDRKYR